MSRRRSYSQLAVWQDCPEQYLWKYVERIPEDPAVWSVGGTAFHECAERFLRGELGDAPTGLDVHEAWLTAWDNAKAEQLAKGAPEDMSTWRAASKGKEGEKWWMQAGPDMVQRFIHWKRTDGALLQVFDHDGEPGLELRLEVEFGGAQVIAIPDFLAVDEHGQLDVVDYKSGRPPKKSLQLGVYAAAVEKALGLRATYGLYYMTRAAQLIPVDLRKYPLHDIEQQFYDFDQAESAGHYDPTPGSACTFCPYKQRCSVKSKESA